MVIHVDMSKTTVIPNVETVWIFNICDKDLQKIQWPEKLKHLKIKTGQLKHFICPPQITELWCKGIHLSKLSISRGLKGLKCSRNCLTTLTLPETLEHLDCSYNSLTSLSLPREIHTVSADNNQISTLVAYEGCDMLDWLDIHNNCIEYIDIKLPEHMSYLGVEGNPLLGIKYWDFVFSYYKGETPKDMLIGGDFLQTLDSENEITIQRLDNLYKLYDAKQTYIDWKKC